MNRQELALSGAKKRTAKDAKIANVEAESKGRLDAKSVTAGGTMRKAYSVVPALLAFVTFSCGPGSGAVRPTPPQPGARAKPACSLDDMFAGLARKAAGALTPGSRVVVLNFSPLGGEGVSRLGVYLAKKFTAYLAQEAGMGLTVIARAEGERAFIAEDSFTVDRPDPREVLERFKAQWGIVATYDLAENDCCLELVSVTAVPTAGAEAKFGASCRIPGPAGEFERWQSMDRLRLPNMSEKLRRFLAEQGGWDVLGRPQMFKKDGPEVPANHAIQVGDYVKIKINVREPCYLYALGWDQTNAIMTVLFPGKHERSSVGAGEFSVPTGGYYGQAIPPAGYNCVRLVATRTDAGLSEDFVKETQTQDAMVDKFLSLPRGDWGTADFPYRIEQ